MKYILLLLGFVLVPSTTTAHTRWFADGALEAYVTTEPTLVYLGIWGLIIGIVVTVAILFERAHVLNCDFLQPTRPHVFERAASTFIMVVGVFLLIAGVYEYLFIPTLTIEAGMPWWLIAMQLVVGAAFVVGIASRVCGVLLALMWASLFYFVGPVGALENIWVLSTALFATLMGNEYFSAVSFSALRSLVVPYKKYALSILRLGTGATLVVLGLSEKILAPEFGIHFLEQYNWNFMGALGFEYSDYLFTLSAGSVECMLGLLLVLGLVTRLTAVVIAVLFTIPLFLLGPIELAGHMPHVAAVGVLILFGGGSYMKLVSCKTRRATPVSTSH